MLKLFKKFFPLVFFVCSVLFLSRALLLNYYPDFDEYYHSPIVAFSGGNPYLGGAGFFTPSVYPPTVFIFFYPLTLFPYIIAEKIWVFLSLIFLVASFIFIFKIFKENLFETRNLIVSGLIFFTFFPIKFTLGMGQINIFIFLLLVLSIYLYQKKLDNFSGFFLGIPLILKLFPVLLVLYFLIQKRLKIISSIILTIVATSVLTYFIVGSTMNLYFLQKVLPSLLGGWKEDYYNQALSGFLMRGIADIELRNILKILLTIGLIIISLFAVVKKSTNIYSENLKIGIIVSLSLLINTFSWQHHFVWLLFPLFATFFYLKHKKASSIFYVILLMSYMLVAFNLKNPNSVPVILQSHVFFGAFLLWGLDIYLLVKRLN